MFRLFLTRRSKNRSQNLEVGLFGTYQFVLGEPYAIPRIETVDPP